MYNGGTRRQLHAGARGGLACLAAAIGGLVVVGPAEQSPAAAACGGLEVSFHLDVGGDDHVDVCDDTVAEFERLRAARAVAASLDIHPINAYDDEFRSVSVVPIDGRLAERDGTEWRFEYDTSALQSELADVGFDDLAFRLCPPTPPVGVRFDSEPAPDVLGTRCATWFLGSESDPVAFTLRLLPDEDDYWRPVAVVSAAVAVLFVAALLLGWRLRNGPLRHRTAATFIVAAMALWIGLVGATVLGVVLYVSGATAELVLDNAYAGEVQFFAAFVPGVVATAPFVLFAGIVLSVPGRPRVSGAAPAATSAAAPRASG